ncbi:glycosyltransferase family 4 protein [soil metagenome]
MKLVVIIPYFFPRIGGLENYALKISQGLLEKNDWTVTVITSNPHGKADIKEKIGKIEVIRLGTNFKASNTPVGLDWYSKIIKILREIQPDLVNAHTPVPFISDLGIKAAKSLGIPTVLTYQNDIFKDNIIFQGVSWLYYFLMGNVTLKLSDKIIITSTHYGKISEKLRPFPKKLEVIPPGVDVQPFAFRKNNKDTSYVLFVGQLDETHRHKGLDVLLEAFSLLQKKHPELKLFIIGKGNDSARYGEIIMHLNLHDQVHLKGFIPDDQMPAYYANAVCLCLPSTSQSEGFGMVIIEAASQKTPSIGTKVGGIPSVIVDDETGLLIKPKDDEVLARAIEELYIDSKKRDRLGEAAYKRVLADFTWAKQIQKTDTLFRSLLT